MSGKHLAARKDKTYAPADRQPEFTFRYFRRILRVVKCNFECHLISDAPKALEQPRRKTKLFLRHDIDLDLNRALRMASIENEVGVRATYMVMVNSPFYSVEDPPSRSILRDLLSCGHEVGLHFDFDADEERGTLAELGSLEPKIDSACQRLEAANGSAVGSISFHRPPPQFSRGPLIVARRVNAYSRELMGWYLSDSKGTWREGDPMGKLLRAHRPLLQLLIHPIWWGDEDVSPEDRLQEFFETATQAYSPERIAAFDASLSRHLGVRRSGTAGPTDGRS